LKEVFTMFNPQTMSGLSAAEIQLEVNRNRRAQALRNAVDGFRAQRSELETVLGNAQRKLSLGDGTQLLRIKHLEAQIAKLTTDIDATLERLAKDFGRQPVETANADFLGESEAPKSRRGAK
jgi:hypothetical protein